METSEIQERHWLGKTTSQDLLLIFHGDDDKLASTMLKEYISSEHHVIKFTSVKNFDSKEKETKI